MTGEKWIQDIPMKKGVLHKKLAIPEDVNIPCELLDKIIKTPNEKSIKNPTGVGKREIYVDKKLKKEANLAKNLKGIKGQCKR
jgi:hypothetical protein